jgi:hypothetical protein
MVTSAVVPLGEAGEDEELQAAAHAVVNATVRTAKRRFMSFETAIRMPAIARKKRRDLPRDKCTRARGA